ncbi:DUF192 domain-containing protein [Psychroserpens sp. BH13MA-6]
MCFVSSRKLAILFLGWISLTLSYSCQDTRKSSEVKEVTIAFEKEGELQLKTKDTDSLIANLAIEIADNAYETQTGLMYRKHMANNHGMLFIFPDSDNRSFYMKNTEIPLDIIYISEKKTIVSIQKNAQPFDETSLPSEGPAKYVLEVNAGLSDQWKLTKGDYISFTRN